MALLRQVGAAMLTLWAAVTLAFFALRLLPGDAIQAQLLRSGASAAVIEQRRAALGLTDPLATQYLHYLAGVLRGDLGVSLIDGQPVAAILARQLGPTLALAGSALLIAIGIGVILGVTAAQERGGSAVVARLLVDLALSTPLYWTGILAIFVFALWLDLLPASGAGRLDQLVLPAAVLGFHTAGSIARVTQANVRAVMVARFVTTARAKGLTRAVILRRHILRVSLPPVLAVIALQAGFLLSGTVITESLFVRPGIGQVLLTAVLRQDYPVVQGVAVWSALAYTLVSLLADAGQRLLDPRVRAFR
ncbi:MAG: ABC transporter permease [Chloroflexi bacterium]|nr:ABC transporter permease [Chloroflexota bacterium]